MFPRTHRPDKPVSSPSHTQSTAVPRGPQPGDTWIDAAGRRCRRLPTPPDLPRPTLDQQLAGWVAGGAIVIHSMLSAAECREILTKLPHVPADLLPPLIFVQGTATPSSPDA